MAENKMPKRMTVTTRWTSGAVVESIMDDHMVAGYLADLPTDQLSGYTVQVGSMAVVPAKEVRLSNVDIRQSRDRSIMDLTFFDKNDKQAAFIKSTPDQIQKFALQLLQQTTYAFQDLANR